MERARAKTPCGLSAVARLFSPHDSRPVHIVASTCPKDSLVALVVHRLGQIALEWRNGIHGALHGALKFCFTPAFFVGFFHQRGDFINAAERQEFQQRLAQEDLRLPAGGQDGPNNGRSRDPNALRGGPCVTYAGFVFGPGKHRILTESDCFCFPTYYYAESFGLVLVEAMAFALPVITTRWRSIPELLPQDYPGFVGTRSPRQIAERLQAVITRATTAEDLRQIFLRNFTLEHHLAGLASAIRSTDSTCPSEVFPSGHVS